MQKFELYQVKNEYLQAFDHLSSFEDITPEIINDTLASLEEEFNQKVLNMGAHIKNLEAKAKAMEEYEKAMQTKRMLLEKEIETFKTCLKQNLKDMQIRKVEGVEFSVRLVERREGNLDFDESILDASYFDEKIIRKPSRIRIREALQEGQNIPGAKLSSSYSLQIK